MAAAESPWLTHDEVVELTARKRHSCQCRKLAEMGIPFRPNAIGRPLVERAAVLSAPAPGKKPKGPNWDAMRKVA